MAHIALPALAKTLISVGFKVGVAKAVAAAAFTVAVNVAFSAAMQAAATALTKKKNGVGARLLDPLTLNQLYQNSLEARKFLYGESGVAGQIVFQHVHPDREWISLVVVLADNGQALPHEAVSFHCEGNDVTFDGGGNAEGFYAGVMTRRFYGGTPDQTADAALVAIADGRWTENHRGRGVCYEVWSLKLSNEEKFPNGRPEKITVLKGRRLYDKRKDSSAGGSGSHRLSDQTTWEWSNNWALCVDDFIRGIYMAGHRVAGLGMPSRLHDQNWTAASATVSDEEDYTIDGFVAADVDPYETLKSMEQHAAGRICVRRGRLSIVAGNDRTPVMTFTESDLAGPLRINPFPSWREAKNTATGTYRDPDAGWEIVETNEIVIDDWVEQDGGNEFPHFVSLPFVKDRTKATRLAKIDLHKQRAPISIDAPFKIRCGEAHEGDLIALDFPSYGIDDVFEVVSRSKNPMGFVTFALKVWLSTEWTDDEAGDPPDWPSLDRPSLTPPTPDAGDWSGTGVSIDSAAGSLPAIEIAGDPPAWIDAVIYEWRKDGDTDWQLWGEGSPAMGGTRITGLAPGEDYEVSILYRFGRRLSPSRLVATFTTPAELIASEATLADAIAGQGALATQNTVTWSTQVTGTGKPANNADVTSANTAAAIASQGDLATMNRAALPFGANSVVNSGYENGTAGWAQDGFTNTGLTVTHGRNVTLSGQAYFGGRSVAYSHVAGTPAAGTYWFGWYQGGTTLAALQRYALPVKAGDRVFASMMVAIYRCSAAYIRIRFYDRAGAFISSADVGNNVLKVASGGPNGNFGDPANLGLLYGFATAPTGAAFAHMATHLVADGNANPYFFHTDAMLCTVPAGQTTPAPYVPGGPDRHATNTGENTAAAISGQGSLATRSDVNGSHIPVNVVGGHAFARNVNAPLSSSSTSSISVTAHTMWHPGVSVSIPSGSITGLSTDTGYYVFYDQIGGTFVARTAANLDGYINAQSRYLFIGTQRTQTGGGGFSPPPPPPPGGGGLISWPEP